ncbi:MAG: hypothetical protein AABY83_15280 [Pseudomonadota bacterium]
MSKLYHQHYTWSHPLGDYAIAHTDGVVSMMLLWDGFDTDLATHDATASQFSRVYQLLHSLPKEIIAEHHWFRRDDASLADRYLAMNATIVRGHDVAIPLRNEMAAHISRLARSNQVALVLTMQPSVVKSTLRNLRAWSAKKDLLDQSRRALRLETVARDLSRHLPGARLIESRPYIDWLFFSYAPWLKSGYDPRFSIAEQIIQEKPRLTDNGGLQWSNGYAARVLYLANYPQDWPGWFAQFAGIGITMHVTQIVRAVDTQKSVKSAESGENRKREVAGNKNRNVTRRELSDQALYLADITENDLREFRNAYVMILYGDAGMIDTLAKSIADDIALRGGQARYGRDVQLPLYRIAQPGQGYRCSIWRPDHTWTVGNMCPVQVYRQGETQYPESMRIGARGQLVGFNFSRLELAHAITIAMTFGGKGVDKCTTIWETYPFGVDWYLIEIGMENGGGGSYRMVVEGFGGNYLIIDPDTTVVNPLPPYQLAIAGNELPLPVDIAWRSVRALAFLLTDGDAALDIHQEAVAIASLQALYVKMGDGYAPRLSHYLAQLVNKNNAKNAFQVQAAKRMAGNLQSFLDAYPIFDQEDNLHLTQGICGVDLVKVAAISPKLLNFFVVFIAMKFSHLASMSENPARILLDETYKLQSVAVKAVGELGRDTSRMGRKNAAYLDTVTQRDRELDAIGEEIIDSAVIVSLMYYEGDFDKISARLRLPDAVRSAWQSFPNPFHLSYRPALRKVGDQWSHLHLTFPSRILDIANTSAKDSVHKKRACEQSRDLFERLQLFNELRSAA